MLFDLAWRNIWRQPHRTALSLTSIVLASAITVFVLSLQLGTYGTMKESVLKLMDGFAQAQPKGYSDDPDIRKAISDPQALMTRLEGMPAVTATAPRATTYVVLSNGPRSYGAAVFGVDPSKEAEVSTLHKTIVEGRYLREGDTDAAILGAALARNLKLSLGDKLIMLGAAEDGSVAADALTVVGLFATGAPEADRQVVEIPLTRFQTDFAIGKRANVIAIAGRHLSDIQSALPELRAAAHEKGLVVRNWAQLEPALNDVILLDASFSLLMYVSLVVIVVFIILNTLLMSVLERTREFGMLMAIGMRPAQIGRMIWIELLLLACIGVALGIALGSAITAWVARDGISFPSAEALFSRWHMPATIYPQLDAVSALAGPLAIGTAIIVAGIVPYLRVRSLCPVSAMRAS
ncbi:MAG: FtsX-like permease family protein [Alphaproteobacteria bacterium]|nr:FtsX-like permease family protein [Alphaproteobacteria bacterium]